ncbi:hypothetical protein D0Y65_046396 [Glycine soja]|uniref:ATP-dependent DNA helicase n=1 Tax=Glycine soja TaxID=3848 RepID=A0A0B2S0N1_GLYSO|nr:hypothetical protein glysoja_047925 [Glycine soja]RZB57711.1 hypothetical protein D0Y65_046396 [Glycine soja]
MVYLQIELHLTNVELQNFTLLEIEKLLQSYRKSLRDFPILSFPTGELSSHFGNRLIHLELHYNIHELDSEFQTLISALTDEQLHIYDRIIQVVMSQRGSLFFLYGYGGTRIKSKEKKIVLTIALSGLASLLFLEYQLWITQFVMSIKVVELLKQTSLIIWEEAPVAHKYHFEALDKTLRDIMRITNEVDIVFGGKVIDFGGDFRQILSVIPRGTHSDIVHPTINASYLWDHCTILTLTKNMRLQTTVESEYTLEVADFVKWILEIDDDNLGQSNYGYATIEIPLDLLILDYSSNIIFPE